MDNATLDALKIQQFPGINDLPVPATANKAGNGSDLINRVNSLIEELKAFNSLVTTNFLNSIKPESFTHFNNQGLYAEYDEATKQIRFFLESEFIQDRVAGLFTLGSHSGITATYDDNNNKINLNVPPSASATYPTVEAFNTTSLILSDGASQKVSFQNSTTSPHFNSTNPTRLTAVNAGTYLIAVSVHANTGNFATDDLTQIGEIGCTVSLNGSTALANRYFQFVKSHSGCFSFSIVRSIPVNGYIELNITNMSEEGSIELNPNGRYMSMTRIS